jgi:tetratricopeptide (TPR) repeat protein
MTTSVYTCTSPAKTIVAFFILLFLWGCYFPKIIILNDPLSAEEHDNLGRIYEAQGKLDLAEKQYREALAKDRKSATSLLLLGDLSYRTGNYAEAESAYKQAIHLQPGNGDIYNNLCWVYLSQNAGIEKAEDLIKKAMTAVPEHRAYYADTLGTILLRLGRIDESITTLKEAVALLPTDNASYLSEAYEHLAEAYRAAGDTALAEEAVKLAENYRAQKTLH